jgi:hypothetical protein
MTHPTKSGSVDPQPGTVLVRDCNNLISVPSSVQLLRAHRFLWAFRGAYLTMIYFVLADESFNPGMRIRLN